MFFFLFVFFFLLLLFFQKTGFDISSNLSPLETNCTKCQKLFYGKIRKKYFNILSAKKKLPRVLSEKL